jgi:GST-like protein
LIEVFFAPTPNGWKITILLEELGVPYRITPVDIGAGQQFEPAFLAINPTTASRLSSIMTQRKAAP